MLNDVTTVLTFPVLLPGVTALKTRAAFCQSALGLLKFCIKANPGWSYFLSVYWADSGNLGPGSPEDQTALPWRGTRLRVVSPQTAYLIYWPRNAGAWFSIK